MSDTEFEKNYFTSGNWVDHKTSGIFTTYYWARKFYSRLIKNKLRSGKILEIGCGYGDLLANFDNKYEVCGVEISRFACKEAKKRNSRLTIFNADALTYLKKQPDNYFDAIIQICVIPHMDDPYAVLKEISRVLKKDGLFLSVVPNPEYPLNKLKGSKSAMYIDKTHKHLYKVNEWTQLVKKTGLKITKSGSTGLWDVPYVSFIPSAFQLILFGWTSAVQMMIGKIILPDWLGVDLIVLAAKD